MCKWGTSEPVRVTIPANLSCTGHDQITYKPVDSCIAGIVRSLNDAGLSTIGSCCGHGKANGIISLRDGREILITSYDEARKIEKYLRSMHKQKGE